VRLKYVLFLVEPLTKAYKRRIVIVERRADMKTKDLIDLLERNGWKFKRHGSNHDIYVKGKERESVVRHRETDEDLAKAIIRRRNLK
jgi:mRNA interferase HicA